MDCFIDYLDTKQLSNIVTLSVEALVLLFQHCGVVYCV